MPEHATRSRITERIESAIAATEADLPALTNLLEAFKDLLVETAVMKQELSEKASSNMPEVNKDTFCQGVPLADLEMFLVSSDDLSVASDRIGPAIRSGFPRITTSVLAIAKALENGDLDSAEAVTGLLKDNKEALMKMAAAIDVDLEVFRFVLGRFIKPYVEVRAQRMARAIEGVEWTRGYCPVCGSWPSLSVLKETEGQRWLTCSLCSHEWRFMRTQCPFCDNQDPEQLEMLFSEGRETERAEACHACKRYLVAIDLRNRVDEVVMDVAPLMLVYLDLLAQGQGFTPGAITDWNVID